MAKRKKTLTPHQSNGAAESPKSVYDIIGYKAHSYNTMDVEVYKKQLLAMNFADLQEHALDNGIVPHDNVERLTNVLVTEFLKKTGLFAAATHKQATPMTAKDKKTAEDILSRGR